jgi:YbbR domain-containing protein
MLTENFSWKIASVALAVGFWLTASGNTELATSVPVSVQFRNSPPDLELTSDPVDSLFMEVRGPAARLTRAALSPTALVIDLRNSAKHGEQTFTINEENLSLPPGVTLVRVVPSQMRVRLERRVTKQVPVEVRFAGPPAKGYRVVKQMTDPRTVRVAGPESRLEQVSVLQTDPVDLSSTLANAEFRVPVSLPHAQIRFDQASPVVTVRVMLEKIPQGQF